MKPLPSFWSTRAPLLSLVSTNARLLLAPPAATAISPAGVAPAALSLKVANSPQPVMSESNRTWYSPVSLRPTLSTPLPLISVAASSELHPPGVRTYVRAVGEPHGRSR